MQLPVQCLNDERFFCSPEQFRHWASHLPDTAYGIFYRNAQANRLPDAGTAAVWRTVGIMTAPIVRPGLAIPFASCTHFEHDQIDLMYLNWLNVVFPVTLAAALTTSGWGHHVAMFVCTGAFHYHSLPHFGDYQDAMVQDSDMLFHSLFSPYLNCGLLLPKEVCDAAEAHTMPVMHH